MGQVSSYPSWINKRTLRWAWCRPTTSRNSPSSSHRMSTVEGTALRDRWEPSLYYVFNLAKVSTHWFPLPGNKRTSDKREWSSERGDTGQVLVLRTHQPRRVRRHNGPEGSRWRFPGKLELPVRHNIPIGKKNSSQFSWLLGERLRINNRGLLCFFESTRQKQAL